MPKELYATRSSIASIVQTPDSDRRPSRVTPVSSSQGGRPKSSSSQERPRSSALLSAVSRCHLETPFEQEPPVISSGFLHDFIFREAAKEEKNSEKVAEKTGCSPSNISTRDSWTAGLLELDPADLLRRRSCEIYGLPILYREELHMHLMEPLLALRDRSDPVWAAAPRPSSRSSRPGTVRPSSRESARPTTGGSVGRTTLLDTFRSHVSNVVKMKRQALCLGSEVDFWFMRYKLLHGQGYWQGSHETHDERHYRLQDFWTEFHENPRTVNEKSHVPALARSAGRTAGISSENSRANSPGAAVPSPKSATGRSATSSELGLTWKDRSWRSKCTAGAWNHELRPEGSSARGVAKSRSAPTLAVTRDDLQKKSPKASLTLPTLDATNRTVSQILSRRIRKASGWHAEVKDMQTDGWSIEDVDPKLPPLYRKVKSLEPWCDPKTSPSRTDAAVAIRRYLKQCTEHRRVPLLLPFVTGHSLRFCSHGKSCTDADLQAVTNMVPTLTRIDEVDLPKSQLTDRALLPFLEKLRGNPVARSMLKLNLSYCKAGAAVLDSLVNLLDDPASLCRLQELNLDGVFIGPKRHVMLSAAIAAHSNVKTVHLADTGLAGQSAVRCIDELLSSMMIEDLDLGWNSLEPEVFLAMGNHMLENQTLKRLSLANCSVASKADGVSSVVVLIEMLSQDHTLTELDISLNRLDFRGALVIEDALEMHKKLTMVNISYNPLGVIGMRSMLRLLASNDSGLVSFDCRECAGDADGKSLEKAQSFSAVNPGGRYILHLSRPYPRALLRMLCKTCARFKLDIPEVFKDRSFQPPPFTMPTLGPDGLWIVPTSGTLSVTFVIEKAMQQAMTGVDPWNFGEFLQRHFSVMRIVPAFRKVVPMHGQWRSVAGMRNEQRVFLSAIAKDLVISPESVQEFCTSDRSMAAEALWELLPGADCDLGMFYISMLLTPGLPIYISLLTRMRQFLAFNPENPTGHYKLDLANPTDFAVADRLILLDRWENSLSEQLGRRDVSQKGNKSRILNDIYQEQDLPVASVAEWSLPEYDVFEFDYSSGKRLKAGAKPLEDETLQTIILACQRSRCSSKDQIEVLRKISHLVCLTALQLRAWVGMYRDSGIRAEIFLVMFFRLTDIHNEKMFRVRLDYKEVANLQRRIGYATFFPFIQPEQTHFHYDMRFNDQRIALNCIFQLCAKEGWQNLKNAYYVTEQGIVDELTMGVPKSWEIFDRMPKGGTFSGKYICGPENRDWKQRRKLLETIGFFKCTTTPEEVFWWSDIKDAPQDVLEFLEFLVIKFPDVSKAFTAIDGVDGNGVITLRELEEAMPEIGCNKFEGPDEQERIERVFRYLDPDNGGAVSPHEFSIMEQLYKEIQLSIHEFVQFLMRCFGEDLDDAWESLDDDGSGEITEEEWQSCCENIGYFGPAEQVFGFLDKDDEGSVDIEEFRKLEGFIARPNLRIA